MFTIPTAKFSKSRQRKVPDYLANLTGWWKLDDGSGTTAADSIGTTDATTETGTLAWASDGVGEFTSCAEFNGSTNMQINKKDKPMII